MRSTFLVIEHEIKTTLAKRSFWITTFLFPVVIVLFTVLPQLFAQDAVSESEGLGVAVQTGVQSIGYVDHAGVLARLPTGLPAGALQRFSNEDEAQEALAAGRVRQVYILPPDFVATGQVVLVDSQAAPLAGLSTVNLLEYAITYNLLGGDERLASLLQDPMPHLEVTALNPPTAPARDETDPLSFGVPIAVMFILFFTITMSSGYMLQSVVKEKENRTAEVLLLSLQPVELMGGKIIGLGTVALVQMLVWLALGRIALVGGQAVTTAAASVVTPAFAAWTVLYFLLGYLLYASALGALGALAPNVREGSQFTFILILPLLLPLWFNSVFTQAPDSAMVVALSLFPLTAPTAMVTRLAVTAVPLWQMAVGLAGLAVTAFFFVQASAHFFRADTLLSDSSLNWQRLLAELRPRR